MQEFVLRTRLCFADNALNKLKTLAYQKILLVTDPFFVKNSMAQKIVSLCTQAQVQIFDQVQPDPPLKLIAQGVAMMQAFGAEAIIALGGGSAIDCAKGILSMCGLEVDLIAIPTTSGTGSEVTSFAILTHDNIKHPLVEDRLRPTLAILEPELLSKLPKSLIADAGMDALAHCIEALAAKNASVFSDALAMHAAAILLEKLPLSYRGDISVRGEIHCAASMAGIAFDNAGLGVCHALAHALGGMFHVAHGKLNAVLLPTVMRHQAVSAYEMLAKRCGLSGARGLIFAIERLRRSLELPETLSKAGIRREELLSRMQELCDAAAKDPCMNTNPRQSSKEELAQIVREVL